MANWAVIFFIPFVLVALANLWVLTGYITQKGRSSFVPLVGVIFFVFGTLGLKDDYSGWIWLLVFLDIGTIVTLVGLPFIFKDFFINSLFCRYRVYQNDSQILTLYKFKNHQTFNWQYTQDVSDKPLPILTGFGGNWQMVGNELRLMSGDNQITAVAIIDDNEIVFGDMGGNELIKDERLKLK